jgi:hypothetical protein
MGLPFWDVDENTNFNFIKSPLDNLNYKVYNSGTPQEQQETALVLSKVRKNINTLLVHLCKNPELWINHPIAYGIIHTFDIHLDCLNDNFETIVNGDNNFDYNRNCKQIVNIMEMTPNKHGIIGLNKPKIIKKIKINLNGKVIDYPIADKRSLHLTIRNKNGKLKSYPWIMDLVIHELTHTVCNDVYWKKDNHAYPYNDYHKLMIKWSKSIDIL